MFKSVPARSVDLDHSDVGAAKRTCQSRSVGTGRFDAHQRDLAEAAQPRDEPLVAFMGGREASVAESPTQLIEGAEYR